MPCRAGYMTKVRLKAKIQFRGSSRKRGESSETNEQLKEEHMQTNSQQSVGGSRSGVINIIGAALTVASLSMGVASTASAIEYGDRVVTDGGVAYYRMNETSGTTAIDSIAAQNGTYNGGMLLNFPGPQPP